MSLINQMLKDLEQRGAGSTDAEKIITNSLNAAKNSSTPTVHAYQAKHGVPYLKISGLMILLAGGSYLWMQSAPALSQSISHLRTQSTQATPEAIPSANQVSVNTLQTVEARNPVSNYQPVSLFESELKYTPVEAEPQISKPSLPSDKLSKLDAKDTVIANLMPAEVVQSTITTNQPYKSLETGKANDVQETVNTPATTEKLAATTKSSTHVNGVVKQMNSEQKSANAYRQALSNLQQGRIAEAQSNLMQALDANPLNQDARQTLAGLLLDNNRKDEAKAILAAGLAISPEQTGFRIALARLQVDLADKSGALSTLEQGLPYAANNADYQSFLATLLQRANRHEEAVSHYNVALSINSSAVNSLVGLGISLQALGKLENAQDAYTRAQTFGSLNPELTQFIDQQLKQINRHLQSSTQK